MIKSIGTKDMVWGVLSTVLKIGAGVLLYPFVLCKLTDEATGIWTIFTTVQMLVVLMDFGFNDSFARNIGYVFSGVRHLKRDGFEHLEKAADDDQVDWNLMKSVINAMKRFYCIMAVTLLAVLATAGTYYIWTLVQKYSGDAGEIWWAWGLLIVFMCWNLYSLYYQALLQGKGLVEQYNKIIVFSNLTYLVAAIVFINCGFGLVGVVGAQFLSIFLMRIMCRWTFYTKETKARLRNATSGREETKDVFKTIAPNAVKVGLTGLGGIIINRSSTFIGSEFLPLATMASFGITLQLIVVIGRASTVVTRVYLPKLFEWRVTGNHKAVRRLFWISSGVILAGYLAAGAIIELMGNWALVEIMHSNTALLTGGVFWVMLMQSWLETNHVNAADFLLSKNEVPFFKASLISAAATLILLIVMVIWLGWGLWGMVLAPTIAQAAYQNWKWPSVVIREIREKK